MRVPTNNPLVLLGGDNSPGRDGHDSIGPGGIGAWPADGAVKSLLAAISPWIGRNIDGYYFALQQFYNPQDDWIDQVRHALQRPNPIAFVESDWTISNLQWDSDWIDRLTTHQLAPTYAALNGCTDRYSPGGGADARITGLRQKGLKVLAQGAPWLTDGRLQNAEGGDSLWMKAIQAMDGSATDGPMGLWDANEEGASPPHAKGMPGVTRETVKYARGLSKTSMVMLSPASCGGSGFLALAQKAVTFLEAEGATPDIYAISYYDAKNQPYRAGPEVENGQVTDSIAGVVYWLTNHLAASGRRTIV